MASQRNIYLINPKFQLKFSALISFLVLIPSVLYPFTIYRIINVIAEKINDPEVISRLQANEGRIIFLLFVWHMFFSAMVFIICIYQTHKVAGPIFKLSRFLEGIKSGSPLGELTFRKGDSFPELAESFNEAFMSIQKDHAKDFAYLGEVAHYLEHLTIDMNEEQTSKVSEISQKLLEMRDRLKLK